MISNAIFFAIKLINIHLIICCSDTSKSKSWDFFSKKAIKRKKKSYDMLKVGFEYMKNMSENWL